MRMLQEATRDTLQRGLEVIRAATSEPARVKALVALGREALLLDPTVSVEMMETVIVMLLDGAKEMGLGTVALAGLRRQLLAVREARLVEQARRTLRDKGVGTHEAFAARAILSQPETSGEADAEDQVRSETASTGGELSPVDYRETRAVVEGLLKGGAVEYRPSQVSRQSGVPLQGVQWVLEDLSSVGKLERRFVATRPGPGHVHVSDKQHDWRRLLEKPVPCTVCRVRFSPHADEVFVSYVPTRR